MIVINSLPSPCSRPLIEILPSSLFFPISRCRVLVKAGASSAIESIIERPLEFSLEISVISADEILEALNVQEVDDVQVFDGL